MGSLVLLAIWNGVDPRPPAWDEAQHLLMAQAFGEHVRHFSWGQEWWDSFWHLSQRYPPLTYGLGLPFSLWRTFGRAEGQLINLVVLAVLVGATQRIGTLGWNGRVGWLGAGLLLLYPAITGLSHVYMTDLPLAAVVALGYWGVLRYWIEPDWRSGVGLGAAIGLVMLTKWNGLFFLLWPLLLIGGRLVWRRSWGQIWHMVLMGGGAGLICWGWYGANWVFVLSNGLNYTATTHYYVECPAGSLCWWTIYLRLLPEQMSPILCGLPLLLLIAEPAASESDPSQPSSWRQAWMQRLGGPAGLWVLSTYLVGYLVYTLIGIKTVRFTVPLLPLLALLSAVGIVRLESWIHRTQRSNALLFHRSVVAVGILALLWSGRPLTPGATSLAQSLRLDQPDDRPQAQLVQWLNGQAQPQDLQRTLVGVLPNTELISSETLTYLARVEGLPLSFVPLGQSEWPELETRLVDRHLSSDGDWGVVGPYGPAKEAILATLEGSSNWQAQDPVMVPPIGALQMFIPRQDPIQTRVRPGLSSQHPTLIQVRSLQDCEIAALSCQEDRFAAAWEMTWEGFVGDLAQTAVWVDLVDPGGGRVIASRDVAVGAGRLRPDRVDPIQVRHQFSLRPDHQPLRPGDYHLQLRWQTDSGPETAGPIHHQVLPIQIESTTSLPLPEDPLRSAAEAMQVGDLDLLSKYLSLWTTLRYDASLTDPDLSFRRRLLEERLGWAEDGNHLEEQIRLHYQLGLIAVTQLQAERAEDHFVALTRLQPENYWNHGYVAFLRLLFTHNVPDLRQEIRALIYPFYTDQALCKPEDRGTQSDICRLFEAWGLIPE